MRQCPGKDEPLHQPMLQAPSDVAADEAHEQHPAEFHFLPGFFAQFVVAGRLEHAGDAGFEGLVERRLDFVQVVPSGERDGFLPRDFAAVPAGSTFSIRTTAPVWAFSVNISCLVSSPEA
jgi:hypothetical protein